MLVFLPRGAQIRGFQASLGAVYSEEHTVHPAGALQAHVRSRNAVHVTCTYACTSAHTHRVSASPRQDSCFSAFPAFFVVKQVHPPAAAPRPPIRCASPRLYTDSTSVTTLFPKKVAFTDTGGHGLNMAQFNP